jgi:hypothetical protein
MPILNSATGEPHTMASLTLAINKRPRVLRQLSSTLRVTSRGVMTKSVEIDRKQSKIGIIDPKPYGAAPSQTETGEFETISVPIPHYPDQVVFRPEEVAGRRAFGEEQLYEVPDDILNEKLDAQRANFDLTWEYALDGALRGLIKNSKGNTVVNLTTHFGVGPTEEPIDLDDADLDVHAFFRQLKRQQKKKLGEYAVTRWACFVPPDQFEALVSKESIKASYDRYQDGAFFRQDNGERGGFTVADNVDLIEYEATELGNLKIGPSADMLFVPIADGFIRRYFAPKQDMDKVNEPGAPIYAEPYDLPKKKGIEVDTESNQVTIVERPEGVAVVTPA